jgi:hypothetical protein
MKLLLWGSKWTHSESVLTWSNPILLRLWEWLSIQKSKPQNFWITWLVDSCNGWWEYKLITTYVHNQLFSNMVFLIFFDNYSQTNIKYNFFLQF